MSHRNAAKGRRFENYVARFLGGRRFWANSGEKIDVESPHFIVQCKKVKLLPFPELLRLAEEIEAWAGTKRIGSDGKCWSTKVGMVSVQMAKERHGPDGKKEAQPVLFVLTESQLLKLFKKMKYQPEGGLPDEGN